MPAPTVDHLEAAKAGSTGQLLFACARLWNELALARLQARSGLPVRAAHTQLFPHIPFEGAPGAHIAARAGISKQAAARLLDELEGWGIVERSPDPRDGRALLVRWTDKGRQGMLHGLALLQEIEAELAAEVGAAAMADLGPTLLRLRAALASRLSP